MNSTAKTAEIINKWTEKSKYSKTFKITEKDVKKWVERTNEKKKKMESNKWKSTSFWGGGGFLGRTVLAKLSGAALLGAGGVGIVAGGILVVGGYFKSKAEESEKYIKYLKKAEHEERKLDVYSSAIDEIINLIESNAWAGNNLLIAKLNFNKERFGADTYFANVGLGNPENINIIFENLTKGLSKLIKKDYKISEEL